VIELVAAAAVAHEVQYIDLAPEIDFRLDRILMPHVHAHVAAIRAFAQSFSTPRVSAVGRRQNAPDHVPQFLGIDFPGHKEPRSVPDAAAKRQTAA